MNTTKVGDRLATLLNQPQRERSKNLRARSISLFENRPLSGLFPIFAVPFVHIIAKKDRATSF